MNYKSVTLIEFLGTNPELPCLGRTTVEFVLQKHSTLSAVGREPLLVEKF